MNPQDILKTFLTELKRCGISLIFIAIGVFLATANAPAAPGRIGVEAPEPLEKQCVILKSANASLVMALVELKRANSHVRNSERRFRLLFDAAGKGIFGLDSNGRYSFFNRAVLATLGYAENDVLGHDICKSNIDDLVLPLEALVSSNLMQGLVTQRCLTNFKRKDDHSFPIELDGQADSACYGAEEKGRNQVVFIPNNVERLNQFARWHS
ncbi:PAS domain S-box protein [Methylomonas sp. 2BW1-5-20]|uniref:PAS domain S-box protein n=1 Tax=Methylomonas sp. 2BW1-5-20 TaxID=3376686 RepID=UPI00404C2932